MILLLFFQSMRRDRIPRTFDFDLVVPYNVPINIKAPLLSIQSYRGSQKVTWPPLARILATRGNVYVQSVDFLCTHVHMYTTCVSISCYEQIYHWPGRIDVAPTYRKKRTDQPGSGTRPEIFPPPSPPRGFPRFHVSYSNSKITVQLVYVCFFLLIRYFITK